MRERKLNRLSGYDYAQNGHYFVTVCTQSKMPWFGEIQQGKVLLSGWGLIVQRQWEWLAKQYQYVQLDEFVVMPDHMHGIIIINVGNGRDRSITVIKSLSQLIGAFKTTSSKIIHQQGLSNFHWQKSFYDHIIRNEKSLNQTRRYIRNNPDNGADEHNSPIT